MYTQILDGIDNIGLAFLIASVLVWVFKFRSMPRAIQLIGMYLVLNLLVQLVAYFLWKRSLNNLPLLHLNTLLEFVFVSLFFREVYIGQHFFKKYFYTIISVISLFLILNSLFLEPLNNYNSNAKTFVQVWLIAYVILYFFDAYGRVDFSNRNDQAISLICFGLLLYYSGSLSTFMFTQAISDDMQEGIRPIWIINAFLNAIFQLILLIVMVRLVFAPKKLRN